jgi:hypothetical protein
MPFLLGVLSKEEKTNKKGLKFLSGGVLTHV